MFEVLNIDTYVASSIYRNEINKYEVKCGSSLEVMEAIGWINKNIAVDGFNCIVDIFLVEELMMMEDK